MAMTRSTANNCVPPLGNGITQGVWQSLATIAGGEVISSDQY
jgi:hypothetical protein